MKRVGVLGGGQLGRMAGLAGATLGLEMRFWDPSAHATAAQTGDHVCAGYDDIAAAADFVRGLDVITYEFENVPAATLERLEQSVPIRPSVSALKISQDRVFEKSFFRDSGVAAGPWRAIDSEDDLLAAFHEFGECIIKTRRFGYDGKGQYRVRTVEECHGTWQAAGANPLIAEKLVRFDRELSLVGVRGGDGDIRTWPLVENEHRQGILHRTTAPAPGITRALQAKADAMLRTVMDRLEYIGVLTIELFEVAGELLVNEMAPRVHNSGHWTIEGSVTSQFENHLRAITGRPLGSTALRFPSVMINCIGAMPPADAILKITGAHLHDYGKTSRPGRKVGHITLCQESADLPPLAERAAAVEELVQNSPAAVAK